MEKENTKPDGSSLVVSLASYVSVAALWTRADHYIFALCFLSFFFLLFSSPNLSCHRFGVYHTSTHGVALARIKNASLKCAARGSLEMQDPKNRQNSSSGHHRTILAAYIFANKACIDNRKKLLNSNIFSTCPHNMVNCGPLAAEMCWRVCGTPPNFNGFRVLAAFLYGTLGVGVSQTAALSRGRQLYSAGRPSRWALAHR